MGYKVKWVEDNLGVSRKALRGFEKAGLMPKNTGRQYRDYDEDDIDRIWAIRVMQGMGYSIKEIVDMTDNENFDFDSSLSLKIDELEDEKKKVLAEIERASKMLANPGFVNKAPEAKINEEKAKLNKYQEMLKSIEERIK